MSELGEFARRVLFAAEAEARSTASPAILLEHLLVGMLGEPASSAARVLRASGMSVEGIRSQYPGFSVASSGLPALPAWHGGAPKRARERAARGARRLGDEQVGSHHLLLALLADGDGSRFHMHREYGLTFADVHRLLAELDPVPAAEELGRLPAAEVMSAAFAEPEPLHEPAELGWRGRSIVLAALGAAALTRRTFPAQGKKSARTPLEMQILLRIAAGTEDELPHHHGETLSSVWQALACDIDQARSAIEALQDLGLLAVAEEQDDDLRLRLTTAGALAAERWLNSVMPLFNGWPQHT